MSNTEPKLTAEQRQQLDNNIKSLLEKGASSVDVDNYIKDFKSSVFKPKPVNEEKRIDNIVNQRREFRKLPKNFITDAEKEFNDLDKVEGVWNNIEVGLKKWWNDLEPNRDPNSPFRADTYLLAEQKEKALNDIIKKKGNNYIPTTQELKAKTKEVFLNEKISNYKENKESEFLENLDKKDKEKLELRDLNQYKSLNKEAVKISNSLKLDEKEILKTENELKKFEEIYNNALKNKTANKLTPLFYQDAKKINDIYKKQKDTFKSKYQKFEDIQGKLGYAEEEWDNSKRDYDYVALDKFRLGMARIISGAATFVQDMSDKSGSPLSTSPFAIINQLQKQGKLNRFDDYEFNKQIDKQKEEIRKPIKEVTSFNSFINYTTDVIAEQGANMVPFLAGGGVGSAIIFASGYGNTMSESEHFENKAKAGDLQEGEMGQIFGETEKTLNATLSGGADVMQSLFTFLRGKRAVQAVMSGPSARELFYKPLFQKTIDFAKTNGTKFVKDLGSELIEENTATLMQNIGKVAILGDINAKLGEGFKDTTKDTATFTAFMQIFPFFAGAATKMFSSKSEETELDKINKEIAYYNQRLQSSTLDPKTRAIFENKIDNVTTKAENIFEGIRKRIADKPELYDAIENANVEVRTLFTEAQEIKNNKDLTKEEKETLINEKREELEIAAQKREKLLSPDATVLETLSDKDYLEITNRAGKELMQDAKDKAGANTEVNIDFDDKQIRAKAIEIFNRERKTEKTTPETETTETNETTDIKQSTSTTQSKKPTTDEDVLTAFDQEDQKTNTTETNSTETATQTKTELGEVTNEELLDAVQNDNVSDERLTDIANKLSNNEKLSNREQKIASKYKENINQKTTATKQKKVANLSELTNDEYLDFIDNDKVSEERLLNIAYKNENEIPLTKIEQDIYNNKKQKIDKLQKNNRSWLKDETLNKDLEEEFDNLLSGEAEQRRKKGTYTKDGVTYTRQEEITNTPIGNRGTLKFADNVEQEFEYVLTEEESLQPAHLNSKRNPKFFIPEAQPKNRKDISSQIASDKIASNPKLEEAGENNNAYSGAPVINTRGEVIQGNNRSEGLKKHYQRGGTKYKQQLEDNAEKFGFTKEQVQGMKKPILVRKVKVDDAKAIELGNYDAKDIETGGARKIDPITTSRRIPQQEKSKIIDSIFESTDNETTLTESIKQNFKNLFPKLRKFLNPAQVETILGKTGIPSSESLQDLVKLVQQFLFDGANTDIAEQFERLNFNTKQGLLKSLPSILSLPKEKSLLKEIQNSIVAVSEFRNSKIENFNEWKNQTSMFEDNPTPEQRYTTLELKIAEILINSTKQNEISTIFKNYSNLAKDFEGDMFESARQGLSKKEAINKVFNINNSKNENREQPTDPRTTTDQPGGESSNQDGPTDSKRESQPQPKIDPIAESNADEQGRKQLSLEERISSEETPKSKLNKEQLPTKQGEVKTIAINEKVEVKVTLEEAMDGEPLFKVEIYVDKKIFTDKKTEDNYFEFDQETETDELIKFVNAKVKGFSLSNNKPAPKSTFQKFTPIAIENFNKLIKRLNSAFPNIKVITDVNKIKERLQKSFNELQFEDIQDNDKIQRLQTSAGDIYGFLDKATGEIYIDPNRMNANTPIHEFGHVWVNLLKEKNKALYDRGIALIKGSKYHKDIKNNPAYANKYELEILEEALVTAIGDKGEQFVSDLDKSKWKKFLNYVKKFLSENFFINQKALIDKLTLDQFLDGALHDLLSGKPIDVKPFGKAQTDQVADTSKNVKDVDIKQKFDFEIISINELNPKNSIDKMDIDGGYKFKAKISLNESLGEQSYNKTFYYKEYPTNEDIKNDVLDSYLDFVSKFRNFGKFVETSTAFDENIFTATTKVLQENNIPYSLTEEQIEFEYKKVEPKKERLVKDPKAQKEVDKAIDDLLSEFDFHIIGEKGANNLPVVRDNLQVARKMEQAGKTPKEIYIATGWERTKDNEKWKYDLPDYIQSVSDVFSLEGKSDGTIIKNANVLVSKDLNEAYPSLKDVSVRIDISNKNNNRGAYQSILINNKEAIKQIEIQASDVAQAQSILLHEIQHAIQDIEGFARGGNVEIFMKSRDNIQRLFKDIENVFDKLGYEDWLLSGGIIDNTLNRNFNGMYSFAETKNKATRDKMVAMLDEANKVINENKLIFGKNNIYDNISDKELYSRLAGEVEARNAQTRAEMTPEQRKEKMLSETEDVAEESKIYIYEADSQNNIQYQIINNSFRNDQYNIYEILVNKLYQKKSNIKNLKEVIVEGIKFNIEYGNGYGYYLHNKDFNLVKLTTSSYENIETLKLSKTSTWREPLLSWDIVFPELKNEDISYERINKIAKKLDISDLYPTIDKDNYHLSTQGDFTEITNDEYDSIDAEEYKSNFNSRYKVKDNVVYRKADHWGTFATVKWTLDKGVGKQGYSYGRLYNKTQSGKINISDFKRIKGNITIIPNSEDIQFQISNVPGLRLPVSVARKSLDAMREALNNNLSKQDQVNKAWEVIKSSQWYKDLTPEQQKGLNDGILKSLLYNAIQQMNTLENKINNLKDKIKDNKITIRAAQDELISFLQQNKIDGLITPTEINRLIKYASKVFTSKNLDKSVDKFKEIYQGLKNKAKQRKDKKSKEDADYPFVLNQVQNMIAQGNTLEEIINSFDKPSEKRLAETIFGNEINKNVTQEEAFALVEQSHKNQMNALKNEKSFNDFIKKLRMWWFDKISDRSYMPKALAEKTGMTKTKHLLINAKGSSALAKRIWEDIYKRIYLGLSNNELENLNKIIQLRRIITIDTNREDKELAPVQHPAIDPNNPNKGNLNKELAILFLNEFKNKLGTEKYNDLNNRATAYFEEYQKILETKRKNGLISDATFDALNGLDYQPRLFLQHITDFDGNVSEFESKQRQADTGGLSKEMIKSLDTGSANALVMNSEWLLMNSINYAQKDVATNETNKKLMQKEFPNNKRKYEDLLLQDPKTYTKEQKRFVRYFKELDAKIIDNPIIGFKEDGEIQYKYDDLPHNFVRMYYFTNGIRHQFFMEEKLAQQWSGIIDSYILSSLGKIVVSTLTLAPVVKFFATGNNPAFFLVNTPRDFIWTAAMSDNYSNFIPLAWLQLAKDSVLAVKEIIKDYKGKKGNDLDLYFTYGGGMDFLHSQGKLQKNSLIQEYVLDKIISKKTKNFYDHNKLKTTIEKINAISELSFRVANFRRGVNNQLKELGYERIEEVNNLLDESGNIIETKQERIDAIYNKAVADARSVLDFSQGGRLVKDLDNAVPYLNVAIQSERVFADQMQRNPVGTTLKVTQTITYGSAIMVGFAFALIAAFKDDDEEKSNGEIYEETLDGISQTTRVNYFILPLGTKDEKGQWEHLKIAKEHQMTPLFTFTEYIIRNLIRKGDGMQPLSNEQMIDDIKFAFKKNNLPIDIDKPIVGTLAKIPSIKAALTYETGYDFYRNEKLDPYTKNPQNEGINNPYVEDFYKVFGKYTKSSPSRLKSVVESIITTPSTSPYVGLLYGGADAMISDKEGAAIMKDLGNDIKKSFSRRVFGSATEYQKIINKNKYIDQEIEKIGVEEERENLEIKKFVTDIENEKKTYEELMEYVKEMSNKDQEYAQKKYEEMLNKQVLDIPIEIKNIKRLPYPKQKALKVYKLYGDIYSESNEKNYIDLDNAGVLTDSFIEEYNKILEKKTPQ